MLVDVGDVGDVESQMVIVERTIMNCGYLSWHGSFFIPRDHNNPWHTTYVTE